MLTHARWCFEDFAPEAKGPAVGDFVANVLPVPLLRPVECYRWIRLTTKLLHVIVLQDLITAGGSEVRVTAAPTALDPDCGSRSSDSSGGEGC